MPQNYSLCSNGLNAVMDPLSASNWTMRKMDILRIHMNVLDVE